MTMNPYPRVSEGLKWAGVISFSALTRTPRLFADKVSVEVANSGFF